jgi:hypothetical protein
LVWSVFKPLWVLGSGSESGDTVLAPAQACWGDIRVPDNMKCNAALANQGPDYAVCWWAENGGVQPTLCNMKRTKFKQAASPPMKTLEKQDLLHPIRLIIMNSSIDTYCELEWSVDWEQLSVGIHYSLWKRLAAPLFEKN